MFSLLERKYDVPLIEAEYTLDAVAAENEVASALHVKPRSPIFRIQRTSYRSRFESCSSLPSSCSCSRSRVRRKSGWGDEVDLEPTG
jgi:DNA-binding GntR family transcriptional regulator